MANEANFEGLTEAEFEKKIFEQRYEMLKKRQIRDAVEKYKQEANEDAKFLVLQSNVRKDTKAKELYSTAGAFKNWRDAEQFAQDIEYSIVVDSEKKCEVDKES